MDSLPIETIEIIFLFVNPKDYTNFILSYDIALCFWKNIKIRKKYKEQYIRITQENFQCNSEMYFIKTIRVDDGKKHGKYTSYRKNGQLYTNTTYKNDKIHGKCISYYENGKVHTDATYQNG
jgi:antitoxin component YwqK of YwqJK toxin-antitoxin module